MHEDDSYSEPVHESIFVLSLKVLLLQVVIGLASILVNLALVVSIDISTSSTLLVVALSISNILIQTADAALLIYLVLQWAHTTYVIRPNEIITKDGVKNAKTAVFKTKWIESVEVEQSLLGRIFHYGTIKFYDPALKKYIGISNIPNPEKYADILQA